MTRERNGKVQVATEVTPGLRAAAEARAVQEGLPLAIVVRRALMHHLGVDAAGQPVTRGAGPAPEWEALSAALGQHHLRVGRALDQMSTAEIRELQWAATELATACSRRRPGGPSSTCAYPGDHEHDHAMCEDAVQDSAELTTQQRGLLRAVGLTPPAERGTR